MAAAKERLLVIFFLTFVFLITGCADRNAKSVWLAIHTVVDNKAYVDERGQKAILACSNLSNDTFVELAVPILDDELSDKGNFYEYVQNKGDIKYAQYIALTDPALDTFHKNLAATFYDRIVVIANELKGVGPRKPNLNSKPVPEKKKGLKPVT